MQETLIQYFSPASKRSELDKFLDEYQFWTNWDTVQYDGWKLPATEEPHYWCGMWQTRGCLNERLHEVFGYGRKVYVKQYQRSCYRARCKVCYKKWLSRQANKATRRIERYSKMSRRKPIHILFSPPKWLYKLSVKQLRKKVVLILRDLNLEGAAVIFHPFRFDKKQRSFYFSPHFHLICFGYIRGRLIETARRWGWYLKYLDVRRSVFQSLYYLLSHCGIKKGNHALTWLGSLSYSKLKLEKEPESCICPVCRVKLVLVYYDGAHPVVPPDQFFEGFVDFWDWYEVKTVPKAEFTQKDWSEYRLEKELYLANKGIATKPLLRN